ncbi:GNAT family N-acetyltransferase [Fusibacter sp. JL216-2]|uniref:GNAT family N-acetyltransferase n=1 Tax=Fusibacter sp. JL216-2 TaxID=3071453 RepID=UPI003D3325FE
MIVLSRESITQELPLEFNNLIIRELERADIDNYANWPMYQGYRKMFNSSLKSRPYSDREKRWNNYLNGTSSVAIILESKSEKTLGQFFLLDIDWETRSVGNMSIRLHPEYCDQGIGAMALKKTVEFVFSQGMYSIEFDVLASNIGAVKSYKKAGFSIKEEIEKDNALFYIMSIQNQCV